MLGSIGWGQYWGMVVVLLVAYYGVVVYRLYGRNGGLFLRRSVRDRKMVFSRADFTKNDDLADGVARQGVLLQEDGELDPKSQDYQLFSSLVAELKRLVADVKEAGVNREELMSWMEGIIFKYRRLRGTKEAQAVNEWLKRHALEELTLDLSAADLDWLWGGKGPSSGAARRWGSGAVRAGMWLAALLAGLKAGAQTADGNAGINQANTLIRGYFTTAVQLMYAIGALVGLIGAVHVYMKWSRGDHDTQRVAMAWFGACIFLVVVATVIQSFFGL